MTFGRQSPRTIDDQTRSELWDLYWGTDIPFAEIVEAYNLRDAREIIEILGPLRWPELACRECAQVIVIRNRKEFQKRSERLYILLQHGYDVRLSSKTPEVPRPTHLWDEWNYPDICQECCDSLRNMAFAAMDEAAKKAQWRRRTMPYHEYLQTPEWQEKRHKALQFAGYRCRVCNSHGPLNVHHRTYARRGNEEQGDLIVLCEGCHTLFHAQGKLVKDSDVQEPQP